jgi:acyl dehydratase
MTMYFDDMPVGFQFRTESRTLTAEAIKGFAQEWDPQPFHLDEEAAKASPYGGLIASGFHTILTGFKLTVEENVWSESSMGGPGMKEVRWIKPVFAGDTLRVEAEVLEARASRSKPDRGIVEIRYDVLNQSDEMVAQYQATHILRRRQAE